MSVIEDLALSIQELAESLRLATFDPADQIRLLCELATFGSTAESPIGSDTVGIKAFRKAGPSDRWAATLRSTSATYVDADGFIRTLPANEVRPVYSGGVVTGYLNEPAATNMLRRSEDLSHANWAKTSLTVATNVATAPDRTMTADKLEETGVTTSYYVNQSFTVAAGINFIFSCYIKAGERTYASLVTNDRDSTFRRTIFNLTDGSVVSNPAGHAPMIQAVGNGWWRISVACNSGSTDNSANLLCRITPIGPGVVTTYPGTVGEGLYIWGAQMELTPGTKPSSYIPTTATAVTRAADDIFFRVAGDQSPIRLSQKAASAATAALCRRAALISLARAIADYSPSSSDEAAATLKRIMPLYDAEILFAGDSSDMATYNELRNLRSVVASDLHQRGVKLPEVIEVQRASSQPAHVVAHSLYQDASRADELVRRVRCPHPLFMPTTFSALSR